VSKRDLSSTLAIIHQMTNVISSIDDTEEVLSSLLDLVSRMLRVANCSIMLIDPEENVLRIRAAHGLEPEIVEKYRGKLGEGIAGCVAREGEPLLITDVTTHPLFKGRPRGRYTTRSLLSVPLMAGGNKVIGVINVNNKENEEVFDQADLLLLRTVSHFVGMTLERARMQDIAREKDRLDQDLATARRIQEVILPESNQSFGTLDVAAHNLPARGVAGDFYDLITLRNGSLCMVLGDVCGKGLPAALYMTRVVSYFRAMARHHESADALTTAVNSLLAEEFSDNTFATATIVIVDPESGVGSLCIAGHQPPLHRVRDAARVTPLNTRDGYPLGVDPDDGFDVLKFSMAPGDMLLLYTDGATEATNEAGELFQTDRLCRVMLDHEGDADSLVRNVLGAVQSFANGTDLADDLTLIAVQRTES